MMILHVHAECCCGCLLFLRKGGQIILPLLLRHFVSLFFFLISFYLSLLYPSLSISFYFTWEFSNSLLHSKQKKIVKKFSLFQWALSIVVLAMGEKKTKKSDKKCYQNQKKKTKKKDMKAFLTSLFTQSHTSTGI